MQTIARANRVFGDKVNGLIVDYVGIFRDLERALAIYAEGTDPEGSNPIRNKSEACRAAQRRDCRSQSVLCEPRRGSPQN